ncbi:MAG: formimidoylglutamate deiminase [Pirellulales bacterium]|nr:formimidoylglutamate deiminase [Pirellulales bacterium]
MTLIWAKQALTPEGWLEQVQVELDIGGRIAAVSPGKPAVGYQVGILLPAASNVHSHAFQRAMAGLTERRGSKAKDSFWTWRELMFRFLDQLTPSHVEAIAAFVQMEMLEAGYANNTEFHYLHHQPSGQPYDWVGEMAARVVGAAQQSGIGLTLLPVFYQYGGCDRRPLSPGQVRFGNDLSNFSELYEQSKHALRVLPQDSRIGLAMHSLRAIDPKDIDPLIVLADGDPIQMHMAEQIAEVEEVQNALGQRPVEWMLNNIELSSQWCLVHCTQILDEETVRLAQTGAVVGLCPITESNLGDGPFNGERYLEAGGQIGIGSDSNIRISLTEEIRMLEYSQRLRDRRRAVLASSDKSTGRRLYDAIVEGGALASGRDSGKIEVGKLADLVALDDTTIHLEDRKGDALLDSFIFSGGDHLVSDVWSAGRHLVRQGMHSSRDLITSGYRRVIGELKTAL